MSEQSFNSEFVSWFCDGDQFELCVERSIVDTVNLLFLSAFYLSLLVTLIRDRSINSSRDHRRRDSIFVVVSIFCAAIGVSHFGLTFYETSPTRIQLLSCFVRGFVWLSLSLSLLVRTTKCTRILATVWWASFFLLITALDIRTLMLQRSSLQLLEIVSWPLSFLLLFCAIRSCSLSAHDLDETLTLAEPLLSSKPNKTESGLGRAGFLSKLVFSWVNPLLALGYKKLLSFDDVPCLVSEDEADIAHRNFSRAFGSLIRDKTNHGNLVAKAVTNVFFRENIFIGFCALLRTISVVVSPLLLFGFVEFSSEEDANLSKGFALVGCLAVTKVVESLSQRHYFFGSRQSGMTMRSALMSAVYEKQLKLSSLGRRRHSTGEIVNYIAIDAYRMGEFPWWFHIAWTAMLQVLLGVGLLFLVVGPGVVPGLVPLLIFGLLNVPFAKLIQNCQSEFMKAQDERLRSTSEILNNMKIIKLQSWEEKFQKLIESRRAAEFKWLAELQTKKAYGTAMYWMSPTIISSVVFLGCTFLGGAPLNAGTVFTVLAMLRAISEPVRMIPEALSYLIQVMVSFDRINGFLLDDELNCDIVRRISVTNHNTSLEISTASFVWDPESMSRTLENIDLRVENGQKIAVCGLVGSGKSSLLQAILGEITKTSGTVTIYGSIAYVSQTSWIQSGTVRDNILFGKSMEERRYETAIKACALDKDIDSFDHGDLTEIGQRGINMSGGQKQRIQLARAVYNDADIYLLDDPFSAVDAHTAATLFNDCVMTALKSKTVVLVTHQVEFLSEVDRIVVMEGGRIAQSGSYEELRRGGTPFDHLVNAHEEAISNNESDELTMNFVHDDELIHEPISEEATVEILEKGDYGIGVQLTEEEEREFGNVGLKPFWDYFSISKGRILFVSGTGAQLGFVALQAAATYWLAYAIRVQNIDSGVLIAVYSGISGLSTVFVFLRSYIAACMGLKASKAFFSGFTDAIFKASMLFFDSTPVGRILTRASSDMTVLDFDIPFSLIFIVAASTELVAIIIIMASVTWQVMIVAAFTLTATKYVQDYYLASARELTRINGTTKAPVINFASETSLGVVTIRAFNATNRYFTNFMERVDDDAKLFFHSNAVMEWLVLRIEALQNLTLFTAAILLVLLPKGNMVPGLVGLSLSYALTMTSTTTFAVRWYCYLSNYVISVERIKQFMHVPPEPAAVVEDHRPPSSWPSKGRIELDELKLRYRPNAPLVLKGITCTFKEGSRVGVVGRTGSGKTTLISALFRLVDPDSGKICIDGIDITTIGLKDLRMKLSIIPQEPTLFRGSVRTNMDPLGVYSDYEIWEALEKCQLKPTIHNLPNQLDSSVSDEGDNWSAGQRQLFCLGRVLLRRNKILVLDEATASIDSATDAILQRIIRQEFSECTVITVAHRVPTVIDSDMVMVLSFGKMVEYEEPTKLMEKNSYFSKLVAEYWSSCRRSSELGVSKNSYKPEEHDPSPS